MSEPKMLERRDLSRMISACWTTKVIGEGVRFGVFDSIGEGSKSAAEIASSAKADTDALHRLMRALTVLGLLDQTDEKTFAVSSAGQWLRRDHPESLSGMARHWSGRLWSGFDRLDECIETGKTVIDAGPEHFAEMQNADPVQADIFNRAMAEGTLKIGELVASSYDFSRFETVMDVGGGYGALLVGLLEAYPDLKGIVFDLEGVGEPGHRFLSDHGLGDRVDFIAGSFFESVPRRADCLVLKYIIHDWGDDHARTILENCRKSLPDNGVLLLVERIVPDIVQAREDHLSVIQGDLVMLRVGGKERTSAEYRQLLSEAGFTVNAIHPTGSEFSILEAFPA